MAIHLGYRRAGWPGLIVAGVSFILPAALLVLGLAWGYVRYGSAPQAGWLFYGIKPVIIAIVVQALLSLGRAAVKNTLTGLVGIAVLGLYFAGVNEIALLFAGGIIVVLAGGLKELRGRAQAAWLLPFGGVGGLLQISVSAKLPFLFFTFLKIGAVLYGSGYVLLAYLRADLVVRAQLLTDQQLIDAVAIGQLTPGPVFTTATFIGYLLAGAPGAFLATLGIFLPSFIFVAISNPLIPRLRGSPWVSGLLDGVTVASLALMAAVTWQLGRAALVDWLTVTLALASLVALVRFKVNSTALIAAGAGIGLLSTLLR
jgi:chromate transporter